MTLEHLFRETNVETCAPSTEEGRKPASWQTLGQEAERRGAAAGPPMTQAYGVPRGYNVRTLDEILNGQCLYHKEMHHSLQNSSSTQSATSDRFNHTHPRHHGRSRPSRAATLVVGGGGHAFPRIDMEVNVIFGGHGS